MGDRERLIVLALGALLLLLAPGYVLHVSPRFAGSLTGGILGITAAALMLLMLVYPAVKHVEWLKVRVTRRISLGRLLSLHIYGGLLASLVAIVHSGHKYQSALGVAIVVDVLVIVATGFIGRYYLDALGAGLRQQQAMLGTLRLAYDRIAHRLGLASSTVVAPDVPILTLVDAIADLEHAIAARDTIRRFAGRWIVVHTVASILLYGLLMLHVGSGIYYGLRWLP
jgi:hypothetical protein